MNDDLLQAATRALREETDEASDGRHTRARVMSSLHQGKLKRRTRLAFVLPLAACFAGGTAWGAATGRLPAVFHAIGRMVSYDSAPAPPAPPAARPAAARPEPKPPGQTPVAAAVPTDDEAGAAPPEPARPAPVVARAPAAVPPAAAANAAGEPAPLAVAAAMPSASAAFSDQDGDLYRLAHEAHFGNHDYARALAGWDAYLRAAPRGRLAVEARYNRALCLLRLGRDDEARRALQPFASGVFGYRQSEASQLLDELARDHAPAP